MKLRNVRDLTVVIVPQTSVSELLSTLENWLGTFYFRIHPATLKGMKIGSERLRSLVNAEIFGVYRKSHVLEETLKMEFEVAGAWRVEPWRLESKRSTTVRSGLMDSWLELKMEFVPGCDSSIALQNGDEMPHRLLAVLHEALEENLSLGINGCIPIVDAKLEVTVVKWESTDPFLFRQEAAVHRAVRDGFIETFGLG